MGLVIADEEFSRGALRIKDISDELLEIITSYKNIIDNLLMDGISDFLVNNALTDKIAALSAYINQVAYETDKIAKHTNSFLIDIDDADSYLYD